MWVECEEEIFIQFDQVKYIRVVEWYSEFVESNKFFEVYAVFDKDHHVKIGKFDSLEDCIKFIKDKIRYLEKGF